MIVKITSKRQITLPTQVLDALGLGPGDQFELEESSNSFILRPRRIDLSRLGGLRDKIPPGHPPFDIHKFRDQREQRHGPALRY